MSISKVEIHVFNRQYIALQETLAHTYLDSRPAAAHAAAAGVPGSPQASMQGYKLPAHPLLPKTALRTHTHTRTHTSTKVALYTPLTQLVALFIHHSPSW